MKRAYSKPEIFFESFKLSSSIANTCDGLKCNTGDPLTCEVDISENGLEMVLFTTGKNGDCNTATCYHGPQLTTTVFGS